MISPSLLKIGGPSSIVGEMCFQIGRDKSGTKVKKDGILESPKVEVFRKFYSKRWSFERWRRAILLQEPGEFFYPSLDDWGFAVSGAQNIHKNSIFVRKDATSELDFEAENLHFHYKMWSNETALKQRKKPFLSLSGKSPSHRNPEKLKKNMVFQACFDCNSPVRRG